MKSVLNFLVIAAAVVSFQGCYTEVATVERNDDEYAYDSDTTYENGSTSINNHYYLDDDYRRSRLRVSFNYYYPSYSSWIGAYYNSYFNDPYWGMYHRPSWYYDPFYSNYPPYGWCYYPSPYYDPWYPYPGYYPPIVYYPGYYPSPGYVYSPEPNPGRPRDGGSTRDPNPNDRSRPIPPPTTSTGLPVAGGNPETRQRDPIVPPAETRPIKPRETKRDPETPWWEKMKNDRPTRIVDSDSRPDDREKGKTSPSAPSNKNTPREDNPTYSPPKKDRVVKDEQPVERPKRERPSYNPPSKKSVPKDEAKPVERKRETRQPSYNPPPQSSPPASNPPRSNSGGSSSSGGNGRKRD